MGGVAEADRIALLDEAIVTLHAILVDRPELVRVRLELARAFFYKGEDTLARGHFQRVLAGEVPEAVKANVQRFLVEIQAVSPRPTVGMSSAAPERERNPFTSPLTLPSPKSALISTSARNFVAAPLAACRPTASPS